VAGRAQPVVDSAVGRGPTEGQVVRLREPRPHEAVDIVIERRAGGIRSAEVLERAERDSRDGGWAIDALQLELGPGPFNSESVAVLPAAAGSAALGRDDDGAARRVDAVQGGGFRPLQ